MTQPAVRKADPSEPSGRAGQIEERLLANYPQVQYAFVQFFAEHVIDVARYFDGDFEQVVILGVIGQNHLQAIIKCQQDPALPFRGGANASRLADVIGIPRETVRRKLGKLEERGWVHRNDKGEWELTGPRDQTVARRDLADLDQRSLARLARLLAALEGFSGSPKMGT
jgi:DNA-binding transcriptional ArsR family regulator